VFRLFINFSESISSRKKYFRKLNKLFPPSRSIVIYDRDPNLTDNIFIIIFYRVYYMSP
jgi:hypothetical protein